MDNSDKVTEKEVKELITYKIKHTFLEKHVKKAIIDTEKLTALLMLVNRTDLPLHIKKQYVAATMLIQIALDVHDIVPVTNKEQSEDSIITTKQLTVLAGDYYSSLYYLLLAEIKDINMIQMLAKTIKEINEYKMRLYYKEVDSFEHYIHLIGRIESLLILQFASFLKQPIHVESIEKLMVINKLIKKTFE